MLLFGRAILSHIYHPGFGTNKNSTLFIKLVLAKVNFTLSSHWVWVMSYIYKSQCAQNITHTAALVIKIVFSAQARKRCMLSNQSLARVALALFQIWL